MTFQNILTISIDAIALSYAVLMAANFVLGLLEAWEKAGPKPQGICAEVLEPIFNTQELASAESRRGDTPTQRFRREDSLRKACSSVYLFKREAEKMGCGSASPIVFQEEIADPWTLPATTSPSLLVSYPKYLCGTTVQYKNTLPLLPFAKPANNLVQLNIRQLKKQASAAKIKNYNVMTKAQLVQALSA